MTQYPLNVIEYSLKVIEYPLKVIWYPLKVIEYPLKLIEYPLKLIEYPLKVIEYPLTVIGYLGIEATLVYTLKRELLRLPSFWAQHRHVEKKQFNLYLLRQLDTLLILFLFSWMESSLRERTSPTTEDFTSHSGPTSTPWSSLEPSPGFRGWPSSLLSSSSSSPLRRWGSKSLTWRRDTSFPFCILPRGYRTYKITP